MARSPELLHILLRIRACCDVLDQANHWLEVTRRHTVTIVKRGKQDRFMDAVTQDAVTQIVDRGYAISEVAARWGSAPSHRILERRRFQGR